MARGISKVESFADRQRIRAFVRSMPSVEVVIEMKTARHRNPSMTWDTKVIFDIDAMALSVPHCDAVVTERHAYSILDRAGLRERMGPRESAYRYAKVSRPQRLERHDSHEPPSQRGRSLVRGRDPQIARSGSADRFDMRPAIETDEGAPADGTGAGRRAPFAEPARSPF